MYNPSGIYQAGYCYYLGIEHSGNHNEATKVMSKARELDLKTDSLIRNIQRIQKTAICYYYGFGMED
ncbi:hypothetical protein C2G38_2226102 [Gigaspora rosea]|uniref:Uncharacterized protein n=1 Tax=Gigaspora rosea TaxID=44941 RepID=A0A397U1P7_9GLOM|nr:hypothetical protein C2G38_2226102 [Gigaspora rosea]